jgi:peptidoglycan/LPS O-acetylase OafA/YrhL
MTDHRFRILDGWRGACALLVALFHLDANWHFYENPLVRNSWLFVDFFFVLSGFVISHAYGDRLAGWREARSFVVRRVGRIWPLHIVILALFVLLEVLKLVVVRTGHVGSDSPAFSDTKALDALAANVVLVQSLGVYDRLTWNFPSWSISTEFYVCLAFAGLFALMRRSEAQLLLPVFVALLGAVMVALLSKRWIDTTYDYGAFRCLYGFFIGHLTYRLWRWRGDRTPLRALWIGEFLAIALIVAFVMMVGRTAWSLAAPLVFGFAVWVFAYESGPVSRLMAARPILLLGTWSYSIYLGHALIFEASRRMLETLAKLAHFRFTIERTYPWSDKPIEVIFFGSRWMMDGFAILYLVAVVLFAALAYKFVEQPGRRFFNSRAWANPERSLATDRPAIEGGSRP